MVKLPQYDRIVPDTRQELLYSYIAGFFDGEGTIYIGKDKRTRYFSLQVSIGQKHREILDEIKELFGGSVRKYKNKFIHQWFITGKRASYFLLCIMSFLKEKKAQAIYAIWWEQTLPRFWGSLTVPDEEYERRLECKTVMHSLKR